MKTPFNRDPSEVAGHTTDPFIGKREPTGKQSATRALSTRQAQGELTFEMLEQLRELNATSSAAEARRRSGIVNDVLTVRMVTLDADGVYTMDFRTQIGSVAVYNHNAAGNITVASGPKSGGIGAQGTAQHLIRPGFAASVPVGSHAVTFYGTAGNIFTVHAYSSRISPFSGPC